jgi:hypothetical protein
VGFVYDVRGSSVLCSQSTPDSNTNDVSLFQFAAGETRYLDFLLEIRLEAYAVPAPGAVVWFPLGCAGLLALNVLRQRRPGRSAALRGTVRS